MSLEGQVSVVMTVSGQSVVEANIASQRPMFAQKVLANTPADAAPHMVGMVFRLCANAQACASVKAVEQAMGTKASDMVQQTRQQLVRMEVLREHLWRVLLDWPVLRGSKAGHDLMKQALQLDKDWQVCLDAGKQAFTCGAKLDKADKAQATTLLLQLGQLLKDHVFYMPPQAFYDCKGIEEFLLWAHYSQAGSAPFIQWLITQGWQDAGKAEGNVLPDFDDACLEEILSSSKADDFMKNPTWHNDTCETTPYARQKEHQLLVELERKFGNGLLTRFTAVLLEIATIYIEMSHILLQGEKTDNSAGNESENTGLGTVEAARGRLLHRIVMVEGKVKTYQIVAPTEWNFHPDGVLKQALLGLKGDVESIQQQAKLLIHAMDPCVKFSLELKHA